MQIEQAIYTSSQNHKRGGYQLAAASAGLASEDARDLSRWGPAHDSLADVANLYGSLNFHRLSSGAYCVSKTTPFGTEYSQRTGPRIYTHQFIVSAETLQRFSCDPLRIMDALVAAGHLVQSEDIPEHLPALRLVGGATPCDIGAVRRLLDAVGTERLCQLLSTILNHNPVGVKSSLRGDHVVRAVFGLLPLQVRRHMSFSTGLRVSARRPFRIQILPGDDRLARQEARRVRMPVFDLHSRHGTVVSDPWSSLIQVALDEPEIDLPLLVRLAGSCKSDEIGQIASHVASQAH